MTHPDGTNAYVTANEEDAGSLDQRGTSDSPHLGRQVTRRTALAAVAGIVGGFAMGATSTAFASPLPTTHQELEFAASPSHIYSILLDQKLFSAFSGATAQIESHPGGAFRLFQDHPPLIGVTGWILELVPNRRIVQAWRAEKWPEGDYSIVRFELAEKDNATLLAFDQVGTGPVPGPGAWTKMYWEPLQRYLAS